MPPRSARPSDGPGSPAAGPLTRDGLERYLWSAADILRGSIDSADYKGYILGLLFLKRLSDVFGEDPAGALAVPERARWAGIARASSNPGKALNAACRAIEEANPALEGVLTGIDFSDSRKLGAGRDGVLRRLVQHFSRLSLGNAHLSEPDMLGQAYEYLIERFADDAGRKGGEFYTPKRVVELMVELLAPRAGMRISDPTCGSGGMLIGCARYIEARGGAPADLGLFGQEKNLGTWALCKMNMLLHGLPAARIEKGDTLRDPKLVNSGALMTFDRVIANPPFSLDAWGREEARHDRYERFRFGLPPRARGDLAFVQHMIATLNARGQLAVVLPHGVLFRRGSEEAIRRGLLKEDLLEAVIGLPPNLFYGTGIPAAILILNRDKARARGGRVLFLDASRDFQAENAQNHLRGQDVEKISAAFRGFQHVDRYARVVDLGEIDRNDANLNISRYLETAEPEAAVDVASAVEKLQVLEDARAEAGARMHGFLRELGLERTGRLKTR